MSSFLKVKHYSINRRDDRIRDAGDADALRTLRTGQTVNADDPFAGALCGVVRVGNHLIVPEVAVYLVDCLDAGGELAVRRRRR